MDGGAINSLDITAAEHLDMLPGNLKDRGISFYMTERSARIDEEMRKLHEWEDRIKGA